MKLRQRELPKPEAPVPATATSTKRKLSEMDEVSAHCLERPAIGIGEQIITIRVGKFKDVFQVHENLLQSHSDFFKAALNPAHGFQESRQGVVELLEEDVFYFRSFVNYIYFSKVLTWSPTTDQEAKHVTNELIGEYVLAEKLQAQCFANDVVTALIAILSIKIGHSLRNRFTPHQIRFIYENTPPSSPLRRLCVDLVVFCGSADWVHKSNENEMPMEFLLDLAESLLENRPPPKGKAPFVQSPSNYHEKKESKAWIGRLDGSPT